MSRQFVRTFPGGRPIDNFATLGAVTTISFTVPTGKKWMLYGGYVERDANASLDIEIFNSADKLLQKFPQRPAGVTNFTWGCIEFEPTTGTNELTLTRVMMFPFPLKAGDYVKYTWSAVQTTPEVACIVEEIDD